MNPCNAGGDMLAGPDETARAAVLPVLPVIPVPPPVLAPAAQHGAPASRITMRQFDRTCLSSRVIGPGDVRAIRQANRVSQTVFARYLGTSESTVKQWESGAKRPSGMARTLLHAVAKHGVDVLS